MHYAFDRFQTRLLDVCLLLFLSGDSLGPGLDLGLNISGEREAKKRKRRERLEMRTSALLSQWSRLCLMVFHIVSFANNGILRNRMGKRLHDMGRHLSIFGRFFGTIIQSAFRGLLGPG